MDICFLVGHYAFIDVTNTTSMPDGSHESFYTSSTYEYSNDACISFFYRSIRTTPLGPTLLLDAISQGTVRKLWSSNVAHGKKWIAVKETLFKAWLPDSYDLAVSNFLGNVLVVTAGAESDSKSAFCNTAWVMKDWRYGFVSMLQLESLIADLSEAE